VSLVPAHRDAMLEDERWLALVLLLPTLVLLGLFIATCCACGLASA
jgi:hypothetical protein